MYDINKIAQVIYEIDALFQSYFEEDFPLSWNELTENEKEELELAIELVSKDKNFKSLSYDKCRTEMGKSIISYMYDRIDDAKS